jgi:hypothetical protein
MKQLGNVISALISTILIMLFLIMAWYGFRLSVGEKHDGVFIEIKTTGYKKLIEK